MLFRSDSRHPLCEPCEHPRPTNREDRSDGSRHPLSVCLLGARPGVIVARPPVTLSGAEAVARSEEVVVQRRFCQLDVFTDLPYLGNPLAVVVDGDGLTAEEMQRFAQWTNLSETTFLLQPDNPAADYRVQIGRAHV